MAGLFIGLRSGLNFGAAANDRGMGGIEATVILLGVGFRIRWNYTITEKTADILQLIDDINSGKVEAFPIVLPGDRPH